MEHGSIIDMFGGNTKLAALLDVSRSTPSRWRRLGIARKHWTTIVRAARHRELEITHEQIEAGVARPGRTSRAAWMTA